MMGILKDLISQPKLVRPETDTCVLCEKQFVEGDKIAKHPEKGFAHETCAALDIDEMKEEHVN